MCHVLCAFLCYWNIVTLLFAICYLTHFGIVCVFSCCCNIESAHCYYVSLLMCFYLSGGLVFAVIVLFIDILYICLFCSLENTNIVKQHPQCNCHPMFNKRVGSKNKYPRTRIREATTYAFSYKSCCLINDEYLYGYKGTIFLA